MTDGKNKSETSTATVKYDNIIPSITVSDPETGWHKQDVNINVSGEDQNSGINGYKYYLNDETNGTHEKDITKPIIMSQEGIVKIKIQTVDKAGNLSSLQERTIKLDKTGPVFSTNEIEKTNIRPTSFKLSARATDSLSGIAKYICYISENGNEILQQENTIGDFEITDRRPNTRYDIRITAIDNAGNESEIPCTGYVRTTGELKAPNLSVTPLTEGATMTGGYYKGGVKITVTDSADPNETTAVDLYYEVVDANNEALSRATGKVTNYVNFSQEGTFKVRAWAKDEEGTDGPKTEWQSFGIDTAPPTIPTITLAGTSGTNGWYKSNVTVTITAGNDVTSKVRGVQYYTEKGSIGGQAITGNIDGKYLEIAVTDGNSTNISITTDGITKIHARTVDNAGNVSNEAGVKEAKKDATNPPTVNLSYKEKTGNTVTVTTSMSSTSDTSGIAKYIFEYKKSTNNTWITAVEQTTRPNEYKYTGLDSNTGYDFRVRTVDNAGNTSTGTSIVQTTDSTNDPMNSELTDTSLTGKTVNYTPRAGQVYNTENGDWTTSKKDSKNYPEYSGYEFQSFSSSDYQGSWLIWGQNTEYIYIVSRGATSSLLELGRIHGIFEWCYAIRHNL